MCFLLPRKHSLMSTCFLAALRVTKAVIGLQSSTGGIHHPRKIPLRKTTMMRLIFHRRTPTQTLPKRDRTLSATAQSSSSLNGSAVRVRLHRLRKNSLQKNLLVLGVLGV